MDGNAGNWSVLVPAGKEIKQKMPWVTASENGIEQTECLSVMKGRCGVVRLHFNTFQVIQSYLERYTKESESLVEKIWKDVASSWVWLIGYWAKIREASTSNSKYPLSLIAKSTVRERWKEPLKGS